MIGNHSSLSDVDSSRKLSLANKEKVSEIQKEFKAVDTSKAQFAVMASAFRQGLLFEPIDANGNTLFHLFVSQSELVNLYTLFAGLTQREIDTQNSNRETVLDQAAMQGRQTLVHALVNHNANTNVVDKAQCENIIFAKKYLDDYFDIKRTISKYAHKVETILEYIAILAEKGITYSTPIDNMGNTLFQTLMMRCDLFVLAKVFKHVTLEEINCQNDNGQTSLIQMACIDRRVKMRCLLTRGADTKIRDRSNQRAYHYLKGEGFSQSIGLSIDDFTEATLIYFQACDEFDLPSGIEKIIGMGFLLDSPINESDETLLHFLVEKTPIKQFIEIIEQYSLPTTNLNVVSHFKRTPVDWACKLNRYSVVECLMLKGADTSKCDKPQKVVDYVINQEWLQSCYQGGKAPPRIKKAFLDEIATIHEQQIAPHPPLMQATSIFTRFINLVKRLNLRYSPVKRREGINLLECNIDQSPKVNCSDLATAFGYLMKALGLTDVSIHAYRYIRSKPFTPKPSNIYGDFSCFDEAYHQFFAEEGCYAFENHYVTKAYGRFFDPTFGCYYDNEDDIIDDEPLEEDVSDALVFSSMAGSSSTSTSASNPVQDDGSSLSNKMKMLVLGNSFS